MELQELKREFEKIFGNKSERIFFAPGRVNLIGEHTDYNGGNVFPCAITQGTTALIRNSGEKKLRFYSWNFPDEGIIESELSDLSYREKDKWSNYPKGVFEELKKLGHKFDHGMEIFYFGNIPNGAGLSSSASIEVLTAIMANSIYNLNTDIIDLIKLCQRVENNYIGVNSGIMDQFIIGVGKKDTAILLDCNTLIYKYVPLILNNYSIVIANTNKKRVLADSKYNERRGECEEALKNLQEKLNIKSLGELSEEEFEKNKYLIKEEINVKRAKHAVYENQRTLKAVDALETGDLEEFGKLMNASHKSLKEDYEVTGTELDTLVDAAQKQKGTIGSRMTGAGFGGCTVSIVKNDNIKEFIENVGYEYNTKTGLKADFYIAVPDEGAHEIL